LSGDPNLWALVAEHWKLMKTLRRLQIRLIPERCVGVWECYEVCPVGCWKPDYEKQKVVLQHTHRCVACNACVIQCPQDAIALVVP
jgi:NAD-dependent dihydropyrimidine dehydrogenase PreA subunit